MCEKREYIDDNILGVIVTKESKEGSWNIGSKLYYKNITRKAFLPFIEIKTKALFLSESGNLHLRRFLWWMRRDSPLSLCKLHKLKLNLESFDHLTQGSALLSIGTRTLSVLGRLTRLYNEVEAKYRHSSWTVGQVRLKVEYWTCSLQEKQTVSIKVRKMARVRWENAYGKSRSLNF